MVRAAIIVQMSVPDVMNSVRIVQVISVLPVGIALIASVITDGVLTAICVAIVQ